MRYSLVVLYETVFWLIMGLPRFRCFLFLKKAVLVFAGAKVGKGVVIYPGVWIMTGRGLIIGDDVDIAFGVLITTGGGVVVGERTMIGYRTQIISANHVVPPVGRRIFDSGHVEKPVLIGSDVWIGANCTILPGVSIGNGSVVAAGSVVTRDVAENTVVAGVPARLLRSR